MDNLQNFPFPLGEEIDVPINKIVRCRWRDEEDYADKIRAAEERIGRQGFRGHLDGRPLATVEGWVDYFMVFDPEAYPTRESAEAKAQTMPLDMVEQLNGHNRKQGCLNLGLTSIRMKIEDYTLAVALDIFLSDNMKEDTQSAGWALGSVRKV